MAPSGMSLAKLRWIAVVGFVDVGVEQDGSHSWDDAALGCMCDGVGSASGIELVQQLADMELGRVDGNAEPSGNLLVGRALGQQRKHLKLSGGQRGILTGLLRCSCCDECNVRHFAGAYESQSRNRGEQCRKPVGEGRFLDLECDENRPTVLKGQVCGLSLMVSWRSVGSPARRMESATTEPMLSDPSVWMSACTFRIGAPFQCAMTSPCRTPAAAPGPSRSMVITMAPIPPPSSRTGWRPRPR